MVERLVYDLISHAPDPEACEINSVKAGFLTYPINRRRPILVRTVAKRCR
jgi:hypothetical protein